MILLLAIALLAGVAMGTWIGERAERRAFLRGVNVGVRVTERAYGEVLGDEGERNTSG